MTNLPLRMGRKLISDILSKFNASYLEAEISAEGNGSELF
jgi:hypothetical protein